MRIGILTQPLFTNYGGILQAYALQTILRRMGHNVSVIRRDPPFLSLRFPNDIYLELKYIIHKLTHGVSESRSATQVRLISRETSKFINKNIQATRSIYTDKQLRRFVKNHPFDAYVVGSDQVWRPAMSPNIYNFYLDFLPNNDAKKVAYAASFGVDSWEYSEEQTRICSALAKRFDAISVRDKSGIGLCQQYLGVEATHVLDPTLLLSSNDYESLLIETKDQIRNGGLFCYVLNRNEETTACIETIKAYTGLHDYYCMPEFDSDPKSIARYKQQCVFPPVTTWLRSIMNAEMVFTDSFHGTAFSIIFNKPFWVIGNSLRGISRIESILQLFNLSQRLVQPDKMNSTNWHETIDWQSVNSAKEDLRNQSIAFLINALRNDL